MVYGNRLIPGIRSCFSVMLVLFLLSCSSGTEPAADCDPHTGSCTKQAGAYTVTLDINPKPVQHMKELTFDISIAGDSAVVLPDTILLDLSMPGMEMGKNQVELGKTGEGYYSGTGIIVKCPSGRVLWRATLLISETLNSSFTFNVRD